MTGGDPKRTDLLHQRLAAAVASRRRRLRGSEKDLHRKRYVDALAEVDRLVDRFREVDPRLGRIVLFGSMAAGLPRNPDFDIDLSFEGSEYFRCVAVALESGFKVDLVDYRSAAFFIRETIDSAGRVVYDPQS